MFHFPGVERLQTRPPSVCRSPPASPGERQRLQHISLVFQELTQQERREDGVTRMMASSNQLANEFTKQPSNRPANPIQNPNPNPTKKYENIQNQPYLSAVQSMPTPLHNLQSPAFNSRFNDSIAVVWWRMVCSFAKLFSSGQLPGKSRKFLQDIPSSCSGVSNLKNNNGVWGLGVLLKGMKSKIDCGEIWTWQRFHRFLVWFQNRHVEKHQLDFPQFWRL